MRQSRMRPRQRMQNRQRRKRRRIGHNAEPGRQAPEEQPGQMDELEQQVDFNGWNCSKLHRAVNCKLP